MVFPYIPKMPGTDGNRFEVETSAETCKPLSVLPVSSNRDDSLLARPKKLHTELVAINPGELTASICLPSGGKHQEKLRHAETFDQPINRKTRAGI